MFSFTFMSPLVYADIECKGDPIKQGRYLNKNPPKIPPTYIYGGFCYNATIFLNYFTFYLIQKRTNSSFIKKIDFFSKFRVI